MSDYQLVNDLSDEVLAHYLSQPEVAIDCEMHGLRMYRDEICLIQICDAGDTVSLVRPEGECPANVRRLLTDGSVTKLYHYALSDVSFAKTSWGVDVQNYRCTKVMSKLVRTYGQRHGLKDLCKELLGLELEKEQQQTDWSRSDLSPEQLKYAANDVLHLVAAYRRLTEMIENRPPLSTGITLRELNEQAQAMLPGMVNLLVHGYGDEDQGWQTTLFWH
ncbi:MAG: ribonuclease D [bacterium]|jgi:ribonuclease D